MSNDFLLRQGSEVTIEAWIKRNTDALEGAVISRHSLEGAMMWVKANEPRFGIRRLVAGTSTDFIVDSNVEVSANSWHHVAGVLINADHSSVHAACEGTDARAETPHLDIYVDGVYRNCASTGSRFLSQLNCTDAGAGELGAGNCAGDTLGVGAFYGTGISDGTSASFNGAIDEVRYWTAARTEAQIQACMNQELVSFDSGDCGINNSALGAYMRFNEGRGSAPNEWTGLGSGTKESPAGIIGWESGWVSGAPITRRD
ncbi:MAG: LamG domain-containing protein [Nitrospirae bacterium]|nr:LamG domain-containing protein [Nitrospirota bacterium]